MLLIIEALLLISAALLQDHRTAAEGHIYPLDMALNSVDDLYYGCSKKMADAVKEKYLKKELNNEDGFKEAWEKGKKKITFKWDSQLEKKHRIAMLVYTYPHSKIYKSFNIDARNGKENYAIYKWHSLHFLITDAIRILKEKTQDTCYHTFRGTNVTFDKNVLNTEVRFGSFASSSLSKEIARRFGSKSCFEIYTCEGADVTKYSWLPHEEEVLIPPYETFRVTDVGSKTVQKDLWCDTVFVLKNNGITSDLNCGLFKKL